MGRRSRTVIEEEATELNMTPMLDVVFILLIFFIVTSVFVKTLGIEPQKPEAQTGEKWDPTIIIAVNPSDEIWIDKRPYAINEVRPILLSMRDENPKAQGEIIGDKGASVGTVMEVQGLMQDLGIQTRVGTK